MGSTYEFTCLPFGLTSAPRVFTKLLKPVMVFLRGQSLRTIIYLNDLLIMNQSLEVFQSQANQTVQLLESLGFNIDWEKSQLVPSRKIQFLGFQVDSMTMKLFLLEDKVQQISQMSHNLLSQQKVSLRCLSQLLGKMSATNLAVLPAPLWYHSLQQLKIQSLIGLSYDNLVTLDPLPKQS